MFRHVVVLAAAIALSPIALSPSAGAAKPDAALAKCQQQFRDVAKAPSHLGPEALGLAVRCVFDLRCPPSDMPARTKLTKTSLRRPMSMKATKAVFCHCRQGMAGIAAADPRKREELLSRACVEPLFRRGAKTFRASFRWAPNTRSERLAKELGKIYCGKLPKTALCRGAEPDHHVWMEFLAAAAATESVDPAVDSITWLMSSLIEVKAQAVQAPRMGSGQANKGGPQPLNLTVFVKPNGLSLKAADQAATSNQTIAGQQTLVTTGLPQLTALPKGARRLTVRVTAKAITLTLPGGKPADVAALTAFAVAHSDKEDGSPTSFLIEPLFRATEAWAIKERKAARQAGKRFAGVVDVLADARAPFRVIAEVVHSVGMAGLSDLRFQVVGGAPSNTGFQAPNLRKLYNALSKIKAKHPDEKTINIGADMKAPWAHVNAIMDIARIALPRSRYRNDASFAKALRAVRSNNIKPRFPAVVFVVAE